MLELPFINFVGVSAETARPFIASFYSSLAQGAEYSSDSFEGKDWKLSQKETTF